jgi:hypothetical protein
MAKGHRVNCVSARRLPLTDVADLKLRLDTVDTHGRERLAMTLLAAIPLAALVFENDNFFVFVLGDDLAVNGHAVYLGLADLDILAVGKYKDLVESDRRSDVTGELFNPEDVTLCDLVLLTACGNHCVHVSILLLKQIA